ncbi:hypothetical protein DRE_02176 [Drechslerella stenobrocha 248]|uniref:Cofilin n=1 Tax=Drechslerella stenobrocha 248 TaxID=1043628 RepID=W7I8K7_9PEZI|nr:hypothetical protein DRE_02176 [Drechslerella stenobrocha 248]
MPSRITVNDECIDAFTKLQKKEYKYVIFVLTDVNPASAEYIVDQTGGADAHYIDFTAELLSDDCRFAAINFAYTTDDGEERSKIGFLGWLPGGADETQRTIYLESRPALHSLLPGIEFEVEAYDTEGFEFDAVREKVARK